MIVHEVADVGPEVDFEVHEAELEGLPAGVTDLVGIFKGSLVRDDWEFCRVETRSEETWSDAG